LLPRKNQRPLDDTDFKILKTLQEDARKTYTAIGERLGIAHTTVYDRIRRMEEKGVIRKYVAIVNEEKIYPGQITALMTVFTDPKESEKVAEKLGEYPQVLEVYTSLSEELLIIAKVVAENQEGLHDFIANMVAPLPGVLRIRTSIITKKFKENQFALIRDPKKLTEREQKNK
jgi:DNA-binding Lrp family transcriptional regulator